MVGVYGEGNAEYNRIMRPEKITIGQGDRTLSECRLPILRTSKFDYSCFNIIVFDFVIFDISIDYCTFVQITNLKLTSKIENKNGNLKPNI